MADTSKSEGAPKSGGLLIALGIVTVVVGILAITSPLVAGIVVAVSVGTLLVVMGIARIVHAIRSKKRGPGIWGTFVGLLAIVAGALTISRPMVSAMSLTLFLAIYLFVNGVLDIVAAFRMRPDAGWGWVLFNAILAVLLGVLIWRQWPISGAWALGVLLGIHMIGSGWSMIAVGIGGRRATQEPG